MRLLLFLGSSSIDTEASSSPPRFGLKHFITLSLALALTLLSLLDNGRIMFQPQKMYPFLDTSLYSLIHKCKMQAKVIGDSTIVSTILAEICKIKRWDEPFYACIMQQDRILSYANNVKHFGWLHCLTHRGSHFGNVLHSSTIFIAQ